MFKPVAFSFSYNMANWTVGFDADQAEHNATVFNPNNAAFFVESFNDVERDRYSIFTEMARRNLVNTGKWKQDSVILESKWMQAMSDSLCWFTYGCRCTPRSL